MERNGQRVMSDQCDNEAEKRQQPHRAQTPRPLQSPRCSARFPDLGALGQMRPGAEQTLVPQPVQTAPDKESDAETLRSLRLRAGLALEMPQANLPT